MNGERVYFMDQHINYQDQGSMLVEGTNTHFQHLFKTFLKDFTSENLRVYHRLLAHQTQRGKNLLVVHLADLKGFEEHLFEKIMNSPL
jgi:hypothetical protein